MAHAIISGKKPAEAYAEIYGVKKTSADANCCRLMAKEGFQSLLAELRAAKFADADAIRAEVVAGHLADCRNEALSAADRRAARLALAKIYGLEQSKTAVKIETDEDELIWRQAMSWPKRLEELKKDREQSEL